MPDARRFILENTRLQSPPLLPELQLYLADEVMPIWQKAAQELGEPSAPPPLWAFAWAGGQAIARYVLDHPEEVAGKQVLDLATGSGLCAIAAMMAGAASTLAADIDMFSEAAVELNAQANGVHVAFTHRDLLDGNPPNTDLILAGDVCYEEPMAERVLAWLHDARMRGIRVLVGDPNRAHFPAECFTPLADYIVPTTRELEDRDVKQAGVYTFPAPDTT